MELKSTLFNFVIQIFNSLKTFSIQNRALIHLQSWTGDLLNENQPNVLIHLISAQEQLIIII